MRERTHETLTRCQTQKRATMTGKESAELDRRDFMRTGTVVTAAAIGGGVATGGNVAAGDQPAPDPISTLKNLRLLDLSVAIEHQAPGELDKPWIRYIDHKQGVVSARDGQTAFGVRRSGSEYPVNHLDN